MWINLVFFFPGYLKSATLILNLHLTRSSTSFAHTPTVLVSHLIAFNHFFYWSSYFSLYAQFRNRSYCFRIFPHNMTKSSESILPHLIYNPRYSYASFYIFVSYFHLLSHSSTHSHFDYIHSLLYFLVHHRPTL